jgi:hypothetical protein
LSAIMLELDFYDLFFDGAVAVFPNLLRSI